MHGTSAGAPVPLSGLGGLVTLADSESVPEGASPRTYDTDYLVGKVKTRSGLTGVYSFAGGEIEKLPTQALDVATGGIPWTNPAGVEGSSTFASVVFGDASAFSDYLQATDYGFDLTTPITGLQGSMTAYGSGTLTAQLLINGTATGILRTFTLPGSATAIPFGGPLDTWGLNGFTAAEFNAVNFGLQLQAFAPTGETSGDAYVQNVELGAWVAPYSANFEWITTFTDQNGDVKNLLLDADGNFYVEDVTNNPTVLTLVMEGITPGSRCVATEGPGVEYIAFTNGFSGSDLPLQYTADWIDRITQVGPGAAPTFTPVQSSSNTYAIANITQPGPAQDQYGNDYFGGFYFLQSSGPGSTTPGNVVTIYYEDSTQAGVNTDLQTAYNSGNPVYLYLSTTGTPTTFGPETIQVTAIGEASPPGQPRQFYYFTFVVPGSPAYTYYEGSGHSSYQVAWQRTLATMTMGVPVPGLTVGNNVTITGNSATGYNNLWPISQALNSASMVITETSITNGVATYTYALSGGSTSAPAVGELVTITGTTNANGALNLLNASIATATGGSSGSFTIVVPIATNYATVAEDGQATTAGTIFCFDPGVPTLDTSTNPIYGTGTGGTLTFSGATGQLFATGTKQGTVFFITRNGYYTAPAPPVTFTIPENTTSLVISNIPLGPPNVVGRGIAITESGQNGTPGGNFFTIPNPVQYIVNNQTFTANQLFINDNITTQTSVFFTDSVLLDALAIDIYGYNLFNQIEIGDPGWISSYAGRNFYGLCRNKIQNFVNLSFDGGYIPATKLAPLGWTQPDAFGSLVVSPKFGDAYYIKNGGLTLGITQTQMTSGVATYTYVTSAGNNPSAGDPVTVTGTTNGSGIFNVTGATIATVNTGAGTFTVNGLSGTYGAAPETGTATVSGALPAAGLISQTAYQDAYQEPVLWANTAYSVRVSCSNPSGITGGNLVISLTAGGVVYGTYTLPLASMASNLKIFSGTLLTNQFSIVPSALLLNVEATSLANGADVLIDRVEVFPTEIPILGTTIYGSYAGLPEQVDGVTGQGQFTSENQQPVNGAIVMYDTLYALKSWTGKAPGSSMYSWQASANLEPAQWQEPEVAQRLGGTCGPLAYDLGEQWFVGATRAGLYLFVGGQPGKINHEIYQVWDAINWSASNSIWVLNDEVHRRLMVGVPMSTPNYWLPNAPTVTNPTIPNVILMCNYQGLDSGEEIKNSPQMHTTMFGTLNAIDMRRKWSLWQIPSPYATIVQDGAKADQNVFICNGIESSQVYRLDSTAVNDHGINIDSLYTTSGLVELSKRGQMQGIGSFRLRWGYLVAALQSLGNVMTRLLPNRLDFPEPAGYADWTLPGGFSPGKPAMNDAEAPLNFAATRTFVEFRENDGYGFELSNLVLHSKRDVWNAVRGQKS